MTPTPPPTGRPSLLAELQRRRVIRVAVVYAASAFVVLQAADIILPALSVPDWTVRLLVIASLLGFPLTLVVAWVFDITPEGVHRTETVEGGVAVGRTARMALLFVTAVLVLGAMWLSYRWAREGGAGAPGDPRTVAVLPFEDFNQTDETTFFANGLHEDVLSQLSRIGSLRVISRTSVLQYGDGAKSVREIGRELGAGTILEGSVRRSGDSIRVVLQLVDASRDTHLWSQTYDRPMSDVFRVQSEIAAAVARALEAELTEEERARMATAPTEDLEAYRIFKRGRIHLERRDNRDDALEAVRLFESAVEMDPDFAVAWAALSEARMWLFRTWPEYADEAAQAADALKQSEALAPEAPETRLAQGYFEYYGRGGFAEALAHFEAAADLAPGDALPLEALAFVLRRQGRWVDAVDYMERAWELNSRSYSLAYALGETYSRMRQVDDADRFFEVAGTLADLPDPQAARLRLHLGVAGDTARVRGILESSAGRLGQAVVAEYQARLAAIQGDTDEALSRAAEARPDDRADLAGYYRFVGTLLHGLGRWDARVAYGDSLLALAEEFLEDAPARRGSMRPGLTAGAHGDLGVASAFKDDRFRAIREGMRATAQLPLETDAFSGADQLETLVIINILVGEYETALDDLELLLAVPSGISRPGLLVNPLFAPLRDDPRFIELTAEPAGTAGS